MFYQNGHQPPPYGQQPPYPQQNNLHYGGYNGGGVGSASASSASGDAILEFPSPYGGPPPIFGGGYAPPGPPAGNTYGGAPQQQSTYAPMPHFSPQQPQPSNPPAQQQQQPAPPPAGGKPLFQPSGMIRSRKPVSAPMDSVLSPPSSANSAAASPSSPVPPLAASASMPMMPSLSSDYEDYSLASAPPAYYQAYGPPAQNYGQQAPSHEYQVAPDIYGVTAPPPYHHHQPQQQQQKQQQQQQQQQQQPTQQQPTPYHNMPVLPQHRLYPSFSAPGLLNEHTQQQQQQQHFPSSPQVPPPQQHYHPAPQLSQSQPQPQISHHYHPAPQLQPQPQQQQQAAVADEAKPSSAAAAATATGMKVLPPLPPDRRRNTVNLSPRQQRLKEQQQLRQPQRVSSDPSSQHQMSELEEKLRDRENKAKRRESVNVVVAPRRQLAGLSLNANAPPTSTEQPQRAAAAGPEEKRRGSGPPAPTTTVAASAAAATVEDLYVAPPSFVLQPESRQPLSTGGGASQKEPETQEDYNYYDLRSVHDSDSEDEDSDDDGKGEASGGGGDAEANYVATIELKAASADSPLPSGYALPDSGDWPTKAKAKAKPEGDTAGESPKVKGFMRQSAKRGNRWEIEFEELEVDKRIGQGAYGSVFKGKWRNTVVAIKTIRENMASFHEAKFKEFRGEAEMMMDMRPHTNVVQLFGVCMRPYMAIVVEFLEGGSLQELLQSKADIDLHMALKIALHAAAGVAHLHAEGICHRDLAARNLLLTSRNKDYLVVKVADFGLSRFTEDAEDNFTSCKVGPLKWMPPESLQEQKYSSKSDAWAMGVVLWEIFSRQEPFPGVSPVQVAIGVSSRGMCLRPPSSCPPEIARLMYDCWAYDPKERPDFRTIARTIEQVLDSNPDNYNIVPNTGEPISCTHPKRQGPAKPAPPPRPSMGQ